MGFTYKDLTHQQSVAKGVTGILGNTVSGLTNTVGGVVGTP